MPIIEKTQKKLLFEEATKIGIVGSQLLQLPKILDGLLGVTDIGVRSYGLPLAPQYKAIPGQGIKVDKMSNYFVGLGRDVKTLKYSLDEIEDTVVLINLEVWARMQLLKNRANEGICFLPSYGIDQVVSPSLIKVENQTLPATSSFLGSSPSMAIDGLNTTNWRCLFFTNEFATATFKIAETVSKISAITIDPVGFGIKLIIELDSGAGFEEVVNSTIYNKSS